MDAALVPRRLPKRIWIYWHQGWDVAPPITRVCKSSWKEMNPGWEIVELDSDRAKEYVDLTSSIEGKTIELRWIADILRLRLLADWGGVWVDATTFCSISLDHWLLPLMQTGFFAFSRPRADRPLSNWFIAAEKGHPIVLRWCDLTKSYWNKRQTAQRFWQHDLFRQLCERDHDLGQIWSNTPQVSADGPHAIQHRVLATSNAEDIFAIIREKRVAVHKLTWRKMTYPSSFSGTPLATLLGVDRFPE